MSAELKLPADEAYDLIDRFLRNNLDDTDYATFSDALEVLASPAPGAPGQEAAAVQAVAQETDRDWSKAQDWKGMDGATAFLLINRHSDGWGDVGAMMNAWLAANAATPAAVQAVGAEALTWCAAALQAAIPFEERDSSIRRFDTGDVKTIDEILDLANAALSSAGAGEKTS